MYNPPRDMIASEIALEDNLTSKKEKKMDILASFNAVRGQVKEVQSLVEGLKSELEDMAKVDNISPLVENALKWQISQLRSNLVYWLKAEKAILDKFQEKLEVVAVEDQRQKGWTLRLGHTRLKKVYDITCKKEVENLRTLVLEHILQGKGLDSNKWISW